MPSIFNFVEKEGKHFAPIVNNVPSGYRIANAAEIATVAITKYTGDDGLEYVALTTTERAGVKGVYAKVRFSVISPTKMELFAVNSTAFKSSE